ncbi:MAG TPA: TatD family hydrolase [Gemmatimonadaceae bacterium]|nr:TatD family hydrolase [Gemmatimonadaceae bacterium]
MATFVDSHVHLADPAFDNDREDVIERARLTGARALICIGESITAAARARDVATRHPGFVFFTAGVHPHDAASFDAGADGTAIRDAVASGAVAIGECGLDYHYDHSPRDQQLAAFATQIDIAAEAGKPLVVHTREAVRDTRDLLQAAGRRGVRGVLHCFTGPRELAEVALDAGWYVSFAGVVTFRKWNDDALVRLPPADRLLVETDAPYLAPVPHRGKRNEPAFASLTLARIASVRGVPTETLGEIVTENAARLFALGSISSASVRT